MRCSKLYLLVPLAAAAPLSAQAFEGTVTMKLATQNGSDMTATTVVKGDMSATSMTIQAGAAGSMDIRSIVDVKGNTMTTLTSLPPGMGAMAATMNGGVEPKGIRMVTDLTKASSSTDNKATVKKLGTTQTIAGMSCEDYEVTPEKGAATRMCITQGIGGFVFPGAGPMGGRGGRGAAPPAWASALPKGGFPLKVWSMDGKASMEVTSITKGAVPASAFMIPDGYMDMSKLGGMMGGRGGGGL